MPLGWAVAKPPKHSYQQGQRTADISLCTLIQVGAWRFTAVLNAFFSVLALILLQLLALNALLLQALNTLGFQLLSTFTRNALLVLLLLPLLVVDHC